MLSFTEKPTLVYAILGLVAFVLLVGLWRTRKREYTIGLGVVAAVALLVWMLDFFIVTDGEQIEDAIHQMRAGVQHSDAEAVFRHVARDFTFRGLDRKAYRAFAGQYLRPDEINDVEVWNIQIVKLTREGDRGTANVNFTVKPKGPANPGMFGDVESTFVLEDGKWKLQKFQVLKPQTTEPLDIPGVNGH